MRDRSRAIRATISIALATLALLLAMWIVVPAPTRLLLPLAVGAPEVSPWLIIHSALAALAARSVARDYRRAKFALVFAAIALLLSLMPIARFPFAANRADRDLVAAFGDSAMGKQLGFRSSPLNIRSLFGGIEQRDALIVQEARDVVFATPGAVALRLNVYRPLTRGSYPVVVQVYGGAWQRGSPDDYAEFARYTAAQGYSVFAVDYRHAPASRYPAQLDDVRAALRWIGDHANEYDADISRVVLLGRSSGAHLAMLAAWTPDSMNASTSTMRIRGVVSYYGPVDLTEGWRRPPTPDPLRVRGVEEALLGGTPGQAPIAYRDASPITYVTGALPPTLLVYGGRDHIVEPRFGRMLHARLQELNAKSVLIEIPWAEHAFDAVPNGPSGQLARYATERFLFAVTR